MNNARAPSSSPADVLERVLRELLDEEEERGMEERLAIVFETGSLREFSGSTFQQDFTDFVRTIYDGEERGAYEFWRRRAGNHVNALHFAARLGLTRLCQALVETFRYNANAPFLQDGTGALHLATCKNRISTVQTLIDLGANVNKTCRSQYTPLHIAVSQGHEELVRLLISRGANIETSCNFGTPLQCAASTSQQGSMRILLANKVNVNSISDHCSLTPLHLAVECNSMECLELLIGAGAKARTIACGTTPLCVAASCRTFEMVLYLLAAEADPNVVDVAIGVNQNDATVYSNRSFCYASLLKGREALRDAQQCVALARLWPKGHYREAAAWHVLNDNDNALKALQTAASLAPTDVDIQRAVQYVTEEMLLHEDLRV